MFHMATVSHKRWDPCLLYRTSLNHLLNSKVKKLENDKAAHLVIFLEIWQCFLYNPRISLLLSIPTQASENAFIACIEL